MTADEYVEALVTIHKSAARATAQMLFEEEVMLPQDTPEEYYAQLWEVTISAMGEAVQEVHKARGINSPAMDRTMHEIAVVAFSDHFDALNCRLAEGGFA